MLRVEIAKGMDEEVVRKIRVPVGEGISAGSRWTASRFDLGQGERRQVRAPMERAM
jgi:hypothetical protein